MGIYIFVHSPNISLLEFTLQTTLIPTEHWLIKYSFYVMLLYGIFNYISTCVFYTLYMAFLFSTFLKTISSLTLVVMEKSVNKLEVYWLIRQVQIFICICSNTVMRLLSIMILQVFGASTLVNYAAIKVFSSPSLTNKHSSVEQKLISGLALTMPPLVCIVLWILIWVIIGMACKAEADSDKLINHLYSVEASTFNHKFQKSCRKLIFRFCGSCNMTRAFFTSVVANNFDITLYLILSS